MVNTVTTIYDVGDMIAVKAVFKRPIDNAEPEIVDPSSVQVVVLKPDRTLDTFVAGIDPEIVKDAVGTYTANILLDMPGKWQIRFVGTGSCAAAGVRTVSVRNNGFGV